MFIIMLRGSLVDPRLQQSPVTLTITRSLTTDVPGVPFALAVDAADLDGRNITGAMVTATLTLPNASNDPLATCELGAGQGWSDCELVLPSVGQYLLRACVDHDGAPACTVESIGRDAEDWRVSPLDRWPRVEMLARVRRLAVKHVYFLYFFWEKVTCLVIILGKCMVLV